MPVSIPGCGVVTYLSAKLMHHTQETIAGGNSPFDAVIMEIARGRQIRIACPFLGVEYLQRMIDCASSWRLLTDVEAWLSSHSATNRGQIVSFIVSNRERVHHCADLHAKVVIGGDYALVGSANFTTKGMTQRIEMGVRFDECEPVVALREWFDRLWEETGPVNEAELKACAASIPEQAPPGSVVHLSGKFPKVSAKLQHLMPIRTTKTIGSGHLFGSTPADPNRPGYDVLSGKIGERPNLIHNVLVAAREPLSPQEITRRAKCKAVSEHLLAMEKKHGYARRVSRGLWELSAVARKLVADAVGG